MTFVDTNVWMYAVGRPHPLRDEARRFLEGAISGRLRLCTSAEVLQELLHAYLPVSRLETLGAAFDLVEACQTECWPVEPADVLAARGLVRRYPALGARDLLHLACCRRRGATAIETFDRALAAAFHAR